MVYFQKIEYVFIGEIADFCICLKHKLNKCYFIYYFIIYTYIVKQYWFRLACIYFFWWTQKEDVLNVDVQKAQVLIEFYCIFDHLMDVNGNRNGLVPKILQNVIN